MVARGRKSAPGRRSAALCLALLCPGICSVMPDATCSSAAKRDATQRFVASWEAIISANGRRNIWGAKIAEQIASYPGRSVPVKTRGLLQCNVCLKGSQR